MAAHPFRWDQDFGSIVDAVGPVFDALELVSNNITPQTRRSTESLLSKYPMGATGSSDGHDADVVGCYYTNFPKPIRTIADFVAALKSRQGKPGYRAGTILTSGPV